jgi:hypothetical protein
MKALMIGLGGIGQRHLRNLLRSALRLVSVLKAFPVLKFFNR